MARDARGVAGHFRRLAEEHVQVHVDRTRCERAILDDEALFTRRTPHDREGAAFAFAQSTEAIERIGTNGEHVAFLRLVAPDLARRHSRLLRGDPAQIENRAGTAAMNELR